jgi:transcriptional regulator with GAF, ATPase, and Fis domain
MDPLDRQVSGLESFRALLLDMARQRSVDDLLRTLVERLAARQHVALARIWLLLPGDICTSCAMRDQCPRNTDCLHLVASAGNSIVSAGEDWRRLDGGFQRFPLGIRKVGAVGATGEPLEVADTSKDLSWAARPRWAREEGIRALSGQPLIFQGERLGVLAVFSRSTFDQNDFTRQRIMADHAAAAIANARAFEEIDRLRLQLEMENEYLREEVREAQAFGEILGESESLKRILEQIELVSPTEASVLILGESGTGKELVAREIHRRSRRQDGPMIKVNCAAVPSELYESEFFGHVKGAFTGASRDRAGRFELAHTGTLFLDEIGEIPMPLQSKLLRVLQEGKLERVGDEHTRSVDVRLIAATNRNLERAAEESRFRKDLYYRLNVFPIQVPPLRRRKEDIPILAGHFLACATKDLNKPGRRLTQANISELERYDWPGNVRELKSVIERAMIVSPPGPLRLDLPSKRQRRPKLPTPHPHGEVGVLTDAELRRRERDNLLAALHHSAGKIYGPGGAAELLGIPPTTLASRIQRMGLERSAVYRDREVG